MCAMYLLQWLKVYYVVLPISLFHRYTNGHWQCSSTAVVFNRPGST